MANIFCYITKMKDKNTKPYDLPYFTIKKIIDGIIAILVMVIFFIPLAIIAIIIKIDSPGPIFFAQERIGFKGESFKVFKFRTMVINAEKMQEELLKNSENDFVQVKNDARITKVGKVLRRLSLDEAPQLINIILGEMSFIGPRPLIPIEIQNLVKQFGEDANKRHEVLPGITGLAQVRGRSDLNGEQKIKFDCEYIDNFSLKEDWHVLTQTIPMLISGSGAA